MKKHKLQKISFRRGVYTNIWWVVKENRIYFWFIPVWVEVYKIHSLQDCRNYLKTL